MYSSIAKSTSAPNLASKRKKSSQGIGKSGDKYNMSATADEKANKYLGDVDNRQPEKMKVTPQEGEMSTVEKSKSKDPKKSDKPQESSKFEFDTGWVDMGYEDREKSEKKEKGEKEDTDRDSASPNEDKTGRNEDKTQCNEDKTLSNDQEADKNKKDVVISVQSGLTDYDAKTANERYNRFMRADLGEKVKSSDESFNTGATYMKADLSKGTADLNAHIRRQWEVFSQKNGNEGTYDDVMPFHDFRQQKERDKLESLRDEQSTGGDKTSSQKAVTEVANLKNQKEFMRRNFDKKFEHQLNDLKWNMKADSDILFFLKRLFIRDLAELKKLIVAASIVLKLSKVEREKLFEAFKIAIEDQKQSVADAFKLLKAKLEEFIKKEKGIEGELSDAGIDLAEKDVVDFAKRVLKASEKIDAEQIENDDSSEESEET